MPVYAFRTISLLLIFSLGPYSRAAEIRTPEYSLSISARSPEQIGAFYEARGFPEKAVTRLQQHCYLTAYFRNTSQNIIWLDLDNWIFHSSGKTVPRRDRAYWKQIWKDMDLAMRFQSTFRWTLMPEQLDFHPDEREGGNLILPYTGQPLELEATIRIQGPQSETIKTIHMSNIQCQR
ncbi:MAG: hypothetical protein OEX03_02065 [Gammaproteobacteria bacterium]|nr:hypothetical protein [Gammaproteobacteria bacterium]